MKLLFFCIVIEHSNPTFIIFVGKIVQTLMYRNIFSPLSLDAWINESQSS